VTSLTGGSTPGAETGPAPRPPYRQATNRRLCAVGTLTLRYEGRNARGMRVLAARCVCGWVHMTAYPLFHKRRSAKYLRRRFTDHLYASWVAS
jgi:hypothetical protein